MADLLLVHLLRRNATKGYIVATRGSIFNLLHKHRGCGLQTCLRADDGYASQVLSPPRPRDAKKDDLSSLLVEDFLLPAVS